LIRVSLIWQQVGLGAGAGGMADDRDCLSTARYGSGHRKKGRAKPYLQTKHPHVPIRADSAIFGPVSAADEQSENQNYCARSQGPKSHTSGTTAQRQNLIRVSLIWQQVGLGAGAGGMADDRDCLSTARYGSGHRKKGRAKPYLQTKHPHVPTRADSAVFGPVSAADEQSENQNYCDRSQRPKSHTSGTTAQRQNLIRLSLIWQQVRLGAGAGGMAGDRDCLSNAR